MQLQFKLLDHPFYQSWNCGKITVDQLSQYARSYAEFIAKMPRYWQRIGEGFGVDTSAVVREEQEHIELWEKWAARLPVPSEFPRMGVVLDAFETMSPSTLLGAVQSFEIQQPEVAQTKKAGLLLHYGFKEEETVYFDEHMKEEEHIALGAEIAAKKSNQAEYQKGFDRGAEAVYRSLDLFV